MYDEYLWAKQFGWHTRYGDTPSHQVQWWTKFRHLDEQVDAELERRKKQQQPAPNQSRR